jgi:hypothetical protein
MKCVVRNVLVEHSMCMSAWNIVKSYYNRLNGGKAFASDLMTIIMCMLLWSVTKIVIRLWLYRL